MKISLFLDYQASIYQGAGDFINVIEHIIYENVKKFSSFTDKEIILKVILSWVAQKRGIQQPAFPDILEEKRHQGDIDNSIHKKKISKNVLIKKRYSLPAIAYVYRYLSSSEQPQTIDRFNSDHIAEDEGYNSRTSGHRLLQDYSEYLTRKSRIGFNLGNKRSERYRNNLFKEVLSYLIDKKITGRSMEEFKADYKAFMAKEFSSDMDFIDLDSIP